MNIHQAYVRYAITATALMAGVCQTHANQSVTSTTGGYAALFAGYPISASLSHQIANHRPRLTTPPDKALFSATWFAGGNPKVAMESTIDSTGRAADCRDVYDWATQTTHAYHLRAEQMEMVESALSHLPASAVRPHLRDLLIVSYQRANRWETRTYNKKALPESLLRIYALTRAPLSDAPRAGAPADK